METFKIRLILSALDHKSFSKAAQEFSYTPSALSHIADSLENELGVKMLKRTPFGVSLTKEGEKLYERLKAVTEAEDALRKAAADLAEEKENHLRIGTFSSISQNILPEIIGRFRLIHPEIKIFVAVEDKLEDRLENGLSDVIFTDEFTFGDNVWLPIRKDPFVAVVGEDMFKNKRSVKKEELYDLPYISINEKILDLYFERGRFKNILDFESIDNVSVLYMVQEGVGFSLLPSLMTKQKPRGVRILKLDPPVSRTIGAAYKKGAKLPYAAKAFMDFIKHKMEKNTEISK